MKQLPEEQLGYDNKGISEVDKLKLNDCLCKELEKRAVKAEVIALDCNEEIIRLRKALEKIASTDPKQVPSDRNVARFYEDIATEALNGKEER